MKKAEFLRIARTLDRTLQVTPLLFGSLGLEQRLGTDLQADDIDILVPEELLHRRWEALQELMAALGYGLVDEHEHEFAREGLHAAYAGLESLKPFAGVEIGQIPQVEEDGARYLLLTLEQYLRVYRASAQDGYRRDRKHKQDGDKIRRIREALGEGPDGAL